MLRIDFLINNKFNNLHPDKLSTSRLKQLANLYYHLTQTQNSDEWHEQYQTPFSTILLLAFAQVINNNINIETIHVRVVQTYNNFLAFGLSNGKRFGTYVFINIV